MSVSEPGIPESPAPLLDWDPIGSSSALSSTRSNTCSSSFVIGEAGAKSREWTQPPYADFVLNGAIGGPGDADLPLCHGSRRGRGAAGDPDLDPGRTVTHASSGLVIFPEPGSELAGFRLLSVLGQGAFARVYLAEQTDLGRRLVALKISEAQGDEPQALARLQHAHIVPIHSLHDDPDTGLRMLCMPYLGGANLAQVLEIAGEAFQAQPTARSLNAALDEIEEREAPAHSRPLVRHASLSVAALRTGWSQVAMSQRPQAMTKGLGSPSLVRSMLARYLARFPRRRTISDASDAGRESIIEANTEADQPARLFFRSHNYMQASVWIAARLAEALDHAHSRGILHRDMKPSNILIAADGTPMLLDFNLSALEGARADKEEPRARVGGTLPYMAPEHLDAFHPNGTTGSDNVDGRSDLYALGLILYEMLGGQHPFPDPDASLPLAKALDAMITARRAGAPTIRSVNPQVPRSLEALLGKCLDPDPSQRYQKASELAEDLRRHLDDLPLKHVPEPSLRERASKWLRRHPEARSSTTIGTVSLLLLLILGFAGWSIADRLETASVVFRRNQFTRVFRECQLLLNTTHGPHQHLAQGLQLAQRALEGYGLDGSSLPRRWTDLPAIRRLPPTERSQLRHELAELLLLRARALFAESAGKAVSVRREALEQGLDWLETAAAIEPRSTHSLAVERARFERALGLDRQADENIRRAAKIGLIDARDHYLAGTGLAASGRIDMAEPYLSRPVAMDSQQFWAWFALGLCHYDQGRYREAAADFGVCTILTPGFSWPQLNRGLALAASGRWLEALAAYDRALEITPDFVEALVNRALVCLELDRPRQAAEDLERALAIGPRTSGLMAARAQALAQLGRADAAEREFAEALASAPSDPTALVARGIFRLQQGDPLAASKDLEGALVIDPTHARAYLGMAHVKRRADPVAALKALDHALRHDPSLFEAIQLRALIRAHLGDPAAQADVDRLVAAPTPLNLYNAACAMAALSRTTSDERLLNRAGELLRRALESGVSLDEARLDPDLAPLRSSGPESPLFEVSR